MLVTVEDGRARRRFAPRRLGAVDLVGEAGTGRAERERDDVAARDRHGHGPVFYDNLVEVALAN
jgi:hypothetical protein